MGYNQNKMNSIEEVKRTIKSIESGSNNDGGQSSPILHGGNAGGKGATANMTGKGFGYGGGGKAKRSSNMESGNK